MVQAAEELTNSLGKDTARHIYVLGPKASGKTALLSRLITNEFPAADMYRQTLGAEMSVKSLTVQKEAGSSSVCNTEIWSFGGHERYQLVLDAFLVDADAILLVFDMLDMSSFEQIPQWYQNVKRCASHAKIYLIGSKSDQADFIRVKPADAKKMADEWGLPFRAVSSKTGNGVQELFQDIAVDLLK